MGDREIQKDLAAATQHLSKASTALRDPTGRAKLLDALAAALEGKREEIIRVCSEETGLTLEELAPEFARMTGTLRMFAGLVRDGSWVRAAIDTASSAAIGPGHDVRKMLVPLGPVAVFGASNFPLAYGVCGGDTASALAAGCPVVVKEHQAHPKTGRLLANVADEVSRSVLAEHKEQYCEAADVLGYIRDPGTGQSVGAELVKSHDIAAVGFTGSREGGMALDAIGRERIRSHQLPIPVFSEMGSTNRVVICPHALAHRGPAIAHELAASILARHGQQCTKPGLILLHFDQTAGPAFVAELARLLDAAAPRRMLSPRITDQYVERCRRLRELPHLARATTREEPQVVIDGERRTVPMLFAAMDEIRGSLDYLQQFTPEGRGWRLNDEIFGPAAIVLGADSWENLFYADAALATTVYADPEDLTDLIERDSESDDPIGLGSGIDFAANTTGRLVFNGPPTGVRVAHGMVHGGPFPATNRPDTTAVGPLAIERWCRPVCFQNCPEALLPPELQNGNPLGIWRMVNGQFTRDAVGAGG